MLDSTQRRRGFGTGLYHSGEYPYVSIFVTSSFEDIRILVVPATCVVLSRIVRRISSYSSLEI